MRSGAEVVEILAGRNARALFLLSVLLLGGCHSRPHDVPLEVAPECSLVPPRVPAEDALALEYRWTVRPGAKRLGAGYRSFVHFVDASGVLLFTDDHDPIPAPETWQPGNTYTYDRIVLVPDIPPGRIEVRMGLFSEKGGRVTLQGTSRGHGEYLAGTLEVLPKTARAPIVYGDGWYRPEAPAGDPFVVRRWMGREAWARFRNRRQDVVVFLSAETTHTFPEPPVLTLALGNRGVTLPLTTSDVFLERVRFRAQDLGEDRWAELRLALSESFVPKLLGLSDDTRDLSLWVRGLHVEDSSGLPGVLQEWVRDAVPLRTNPPSKIHVAPHAVVGSSPERPGGKSTAK
jgi:hypothetical protein